ncbi:protein NRT1/ PTR FAMILY 5.10 isoform X1 [Populus trichocarpa]|nr:protein NRT1/ PTR FAMILY 5.10 isoform X1 [Populus trichocarpa]
MTISHLSNISSGTERSSAATPLIEAGDDSVNGSVDYKGNPVHRSTSGGWRSASFITAVEVAERFAYFGISSNLITYLTGPLGQSTASAAANVNTWSGTATLLPLLGAFVADSFLGRYRTIIAASLIYILGLGLLTLAATLTSDSVHDFQNIKDAMLSTPSQFQVTLFFFSIYLVAFGQGGHKPCALAFGADQFDGQNPKESKAKSSFFNWWYFYSSVGVNLTLVVMVYIQDNLSWALGFGIPCIVMTTTLLILLLGSRTYRYSVNGNEKNPFMRIGRVIHRAIRNRHTTPPSAMPGEEDACQWHQSHEQFKFLNKALLAPDGSLVDQNVCSVSDVEDTKALLKLVPIWITSLAYATVFAQTTTFFTKQGATLDRTIVSGFKIPAASLQIFIGFAIILFIPVYDRIVVPISRGLTRKPSGITMLQRIGTGMVFSAISMVTAALVEMKRLETAKEHGLVDLPNVTVPMSIWWLVPQYILCGIADVLTIVGLQEFCYDQVPKELRSLGISLYLSILGVGNFLSSFLVSVIDEATSGDGQESWFANNLNRAHLDYFYWLLAGLSALGFSAYLYFARSYVYNRERAI